MVNPLLNQQGISLLIQSFDGTNPFFKLLQEGKLLPPEDFLFGDPTQKTPSLGNKSKTLLRIHSFFKGHMADEKGDVKRELLDLTGVPMVESYGTLVEQKFKYNTEFKEILWRVLFILVKGPMQLVQHRATDGRWLQHAHIFIFICETHLPALADWGYWFVANIDQKSRDIQVLIGNDNKCGHASLYYLCRYAYWCTGSKRKEQIMDDILEKTHPTTKKSLKRKLKKLFKDDAERAQVKGLQRPDKFPGQDQFDLTATDTEPEDAAEDSAEEESMASSDDGLFADESDADSDYDVDESSNAPSESDSDFDADVPVSPLESIHLVVELQDTSTTKKDNEISSLKVRLLDVLDEKEALADKAERLEKQLEMEKREKEIEKREKKQAVAALEMEKREKEALEDKQGGRTPGTAGCQGRRNRGQARRLVGDLFVPIISTACSDA